MCSEIDHYSSVIRRMSGSDKPQISPLQKEDERQSIINPGNSSENLTSCTEIASETVEEDDPDERDTEENDPIAAVSDRKSGKQISEEEDDGFKTPTTSDHRIPATTECPPAPRKPSKLKRKASPSQGARRSLQFEADVESIFRSDRDDTEDQKIKKARTDDKDRS